ncbi:MAG: Ig-like domain repeat protein [Terracidiphilus sp.]
MRGIFRRSPRLELVRGLAIALALPALSVAAAHATGVDTTTTLTATATQAAEIGPSATCTLTNLAVVVTGTEGVPAGTVAIEDGTEPGAVQLASAPLDPTGKANFVFDLPTGSYSLSAVYAGDGTAFNTSASAAASVSITSQCDSAFVVNVSTSTSATDPTITLTPGQAGTATITVTPSQEFVSSLTGPAFVTISCSGLSDLASCTFTPENVEILPGQSAGVVSSMVIQTYAANTTSIKPASRPGRGSSPIAWAFLLPGALVLGGLGWGARRRSWATRLSLMALVGLVTLLGTTACNPRYYYENHGPQPNPPTPAGTYTVKVAAQTSNGVTATTYFTSFELTVK